jgi:hypothetical protein
MFDVEFGEMVDIREVSRLTGLSVHQLRSWRKPEFVHLARFETYRSPLNSAVWYRLADVELFLKEQGIVVGSSGLRRDVDLPAAFRAPLAVPVSEGVRQALAELSSITTETMWLRWSSRLSEMLGAEYPKRLRAEQARLYALWRGVDVGEVEVFVPFGGKQDFPEQFFVGNVLAFRRMLADVREWKVSDEELIGVAVGDVPPSREVK